MINYIKDYEKAIKYSSLETIKGLVSNEEPVKIAPIIADAVEEYGHPTLAKYVRKAGEDWDHPRHPYKQDAYTYFESSSGRSFTDENGHRILGRAHDPGVALSSVREIDPESLTMYSRERYHMDKDIYVSHAVGHGFNWYDTSPTPSYLNITFRRHDGSYFHIRHRGTLEEHVKDLEEMAKEGVDGAKYWLGPANNIYEHKRRLNNEQI